MGLEDTSFNNGHQGHIPHCALTLAVSEVSWYWSHWSRSTDTAAMAIVRNLYAELVYFDIMVALCTWHNTERVLFWCNKYDIIIMAPTPTPNGDGCVTTAVVCFCLSVCLFVYVHVVDITDNVRTYINKICSIDRTWYNNEQSVICCGYSGSLSLSGYEYFLFFLWGLGWGWGVPWRPYVHLYVIIQSALHSLTHSGIVISNGHRDVCQHSVFKTSNLQVLLMKVLMVLHVRSC